MTDDLDRRVAVTGLDERLRAIVDDAVDGPLRRFIGGQPFPAETFERLVAFARACAGVGAEVEREACARVAEVVSHDAGDAPEFHLACSLIADDIRARSRS